MNIFLTDANKPLKPPELDKTISLAEKFEALKSVLETGKGISIGMFEAKEHLKALYLGLDIQIPYSINILDPKVSKTIHVCALNDPLGQTQSPVGSDHYFPLKIVLLCNILKKWGRSIGHV